MAGDQKLSALFVVPPRGLNKKKLAVDRVYGCNYGFDYKPPIHLLTMATVAKDYASHVRFLDCPAEGYNTAKMISYIQDNKPDLAVFFTVWLSSPEDLAAAALISENSQDTKCIFTGPYPTWRPQMFLKDEDYFVIRGEPEEALADILKGRFLSTDYPAIKNLSFIRQGKAIHNPARPLLDINQLPAPDRKLLKGDYSINRLRAHPATIGCFSRGCRYSCTFCASQAADQATELECARINAPKPQLRLRAAAKVIEEFHQIASLGYRAVEVCDNQFVWDKARTMEICRGIKDLGLEWICCSRADYLLDQELLKAMQGSGCRLVYLGSESFDQQILNDINKGLTVEDVYKATRLLKDAGIEPEVSVLLGASRLETETTIRKSIQAAKQCAGRFVHYSIALPLPQTGLYKAAMANKWIRTKDFVPVDNVREGLLELPHIGSRRLEKIIKACYARRYFRPGFILSQAAQSLSGRNLRSRFSSLFRFLSYLNGYRR